MIRQDDIIRADTGKILMYLPENKPWGKAARLAIYKGHKLEETDFTEVPETNYENIERSWYDLRGMTYAAIKTFIIKLHYSNDDQIALMLNYQSDPDKYAENYNRMQEWRDYAGEIAKKYTDQ